MARGLVDRLTVLAGRLRRGRSYDPPSGRVLLNVGSSLYVAPGWVNIDGALNLLFAGLPAPLLRLAYRLSGLGGVFTEDQYVALLREHRFVHHDLRYGIPFPDGCAEVVFCSHTLEHLTRSGGAGLMREAYRVLRPGGLVHVSIPDLAQPMEAYADGERFAAIDSLFEDADLGSFARHRYMYDERMLGELLGSVGFVSPVRFGYREGECPDLDVLDMRPGSLVMEARKPSS